MSFISQFTFDAGTNTYTLNNELVLNSHTTHDFSDVSQNITIDGNYKKITINFNDLDGLFSGGGVINVDPSNDNILSEYFLEFKNFIIEINGNVTCGLIKATGSIKIINSQLIIRGNINNLGGGLIYVSLSSSSSFKSILVEKSNAIVHGNIGANSGPLIGFMANGNFATLTNSYSVVNGNLDANAGAFLGAYVGANRNIQISGCYCIFVGSMGDYTGIIGGSYLGSNGTISVTDFYAITQINGVQSLNISADNYACWISNHRTSLKPSITLTRVGAFDLSNQVISQELKIRFYDGFTNIGSDITLTGTFSINTIYNNFKTNILDNLSNTYFDTENFLFRHNTNIVINSYEINKLKNVTNLNWLLKDGILSNNINSGGDPIIYPLLGEKFALAKHIRYVNLIADYRNKIFVNAEVDMLKLTDFPKIIYGNEGFIDTINLSHIYINSYYRKFHVRFVEESIKIDADTLEITKLTSLDKLKFVLTKPKSGIKSVSFDKTYPLLDSTKTIKIGLGNYLLTITSDINTDDRHHLELLNVKNIDLSHTCGVLISKDRVIKISDLSGPELYNYTSNPFA